MPQTLLQIANSALIKIGAARISAFSETTKQAEVADAVIRSLRDSTLRSYNWSFAKNVTASITPTVQAFASWTHSAALPTECLRVVAVYDATTKARISSYEIGSVATVESVCLSSVSPVIIKYIGQPTSASESSYVYPDDFAQALSCLLAAEISTAIFDSPERRDTWLAQFVSAIRMARFCNTIEQPVASMPNADWIAARQLMFNADFWSANNDPMGSSSSQQQRSE